MSDNKIPRGSFSTEIDWEKKGLIIVNLEDAKKDFQLQSLLDRCPGFSIWIDDENQTCGFKNLDLWNEKIAHLIKIGYKKM